MKDKDLCWCNSQKTYDICHKNYDLQMNKIKLKPFLNQVYPPKEIIKNEFDILGIKKAAKINNEALDLVDEKICAGITTEDINRLVHDYTIKNGGIPAPLNYEGFPKSVCTSINNVVCHGIPSEKVILKDGDIINVDITTIVDGYFADASRMFMIGNVSDEGQKIVKVAKECLEAGVSAIKPWGFLGDIGAAVEKVAKKYKCSIVTDLGGHGIGKKFHEEPFVPHVGKKNTGMLLTPGMVFTVEPMINLGTKNVVIDPFDNWTIYTKDGRLSAQWEHTILVTETGIEILAY